MSRLPPSDRYLDRGAFARGGSSTVHLTVDQVLDRTIVAKVATSSAPADLERFHREARVTAQLEHPNIVPVHDLGPTWFTMKHIEGTTLSHVLRSEPYSTALLGTVVDALLRVCDALSFAHDRGIIHRDLKPENIMLGSFGQVYLMDWGIAQIRGDTDSPTAGTAGWMSPEQSRGELATPRTDVWGIGALLYATLCGQKPNAGLTPEQRAARTEVRHPRVAAPTRALPPELVRIAMKAMAIDPADRYASIAAFAEDLRAARTTGWWFEQRSFRPDEEIVREGDVADCAFLVVEGVCEVQQGGGPIAEFGPGEIFGEAALLDGGLRSATVIAVTDVVLRVLTREALDAELARIGWVGPLVRGLASRFHELSLDHLDRVRR